MRSFRLATDMTTGTIWRHLVLFALPTAIGLLFQQLYNTVDTIVVGRFVGTQALAAVGGTSNIVNTLVGIGSGLAAGASVVISQKYGAKDDAALSMAVHTTLSLTFIISVVLTAAGLLLVQPLLRLMAMPEDTFGDAVIYLNIYFSGMLGLFIYNMGSGILRAVGDSRRPLVFLCFSAILNTVLDIFFVTVLNLGVAGVAYATIIAQFCSAGLVLWVLSRDTAAYGLRWRKLSLNPQMLKTIWRLGYPAAIQNAVVAFSNVFVQSYMAFFGSACLAGWSSYSKLDSFILIPLQSLSMACTTFVAQNHGASQGRRARRGLLVSLGLSISITFLLSILVLIFSRGCIQFFSEDEEVIRYGSYFINIVSIFYVFIAIYQNLIGALRGIGRAQVPMVVIILSFVAFRQCYLLVVKNLLGNSLALIAMGYPFGWILCSAILLVYLRKTPLGQRKPRATGSI